MVVAEAAVVVAAGVEAVEAANSTVDAQPLLDRRGHTAVGHAPRSRTVE
ncbi:hypothetical protein ACWIGW_10280 [Nocardia brasiliensis]